MAEHKRKNPRQVQADKAKQLRYTIISRMAKALQKEFSLISNFKLGYRNKEDISTLPPYVLVVGSQNVLTNNAEQVVVRNGYQLDGPASTQNTYGIDSAYDFDTHSVIGIQNLRKWGTNLQVRYVNPATNAVSWVTIQSNLSATNVCNFTEYWDSVKNVCLYVNGSASVNRWSGGVGSFASATSSTITLSGASNITSQNFDSSGNLIINGVSYAYTAGGITASQPFTQTPVTADVDIRNGQWVSQKFTTGSSAVNLTTATLKIKLNVSSGTWPDWGNPTVQAAVFTDNAGVPGTLLNRTYGSASGTANGNYDITFNLGTNVTPNTNYHLAFTTTYPVGPLPGPAVTYTLTAFIGASGSVGTNVGQSNSEDIPPLAWTPSNGYLNMTVNENDLNSLVFAGVTPDPSAAGISVGDAVVQKPTVGSALINGSSLTTLDLIGTFRNQVYYGSFTNPTVYITKVNSFTDTTSSTPRIVGEGANVTLDAPPSAFISQTDGFYISAGLNYWYRTKFTLSADLASESFEIDRLKTSSNQGAVSQSYVNKFKNSIVYISHESIFNALGPVKNILADAQVVNMSDGIRNDMNAYTFSGGSVHYFNYDVYFSVPAQGVVRIYNVNNKYWEAPQTMPVGLFYEVNGELYGHDSTTDQSYALFVPGLYRDNETPIHAVAAFPYVSSLGAQANQLKFFNKHYTEGYIAGNTTLTLQFNYDFGAFSGTYSAAIKGSDTRIVFNKLTDGSLGTDTLGSQPIGTILNLPNQPVIPKFRVVNTFNPTNTYEYQTIYSSYDLDANWSLLRFGPAIGPARDTQAGIQE